MLRLSSLPPNSAVEGNNSLRAFCFFCKSLGYRVVHAGCEALFFIQSENSVFEGNRASRLKCALGSLVESISLGNFTKHGNLGRQSITVEFWGLNCPIVPARLTVSSVFWRVVPAKAGALPARLALWYTQYKRRSFALPSHASEASARKNSGERVGHG